MAATAKAAASPTDADVLLHPELLSRDYLRKILTQRQVNTGDCGGGEQLTELFVRHVMPRPQRNLPDNRWGRRVQRRRGSGPGAVARQPPRGGPPPGGALRLRKPDGGGASTGTLDRLKPPPAANAANLKREATSSADPKPPEVKKKIQHVTWP